MKRSTVKIDRMWDGATAVADERVQLTLDWVAGDLLVQVDAPFHGDPPPPAPPGRCDRLWEHEVVELFLVGSDDRYLEIELGPHGHYLALGLHGARNVVDAEIAIDFRSEVTSERWTGTGKILGRDLPAGLERWNAFAMHGAGASRRHLAAHPLPGTRPDFHRIEAFPKFATTAVQDRIPYIDLLFEARRDGAPAARLFERFLHWGYWESPRSATGTVEDFAAAMERLNALVVDAAAIRDGDSVLDAGCGFGATLASIDAARTGTELVGVNIDARQLAAARVSVLPRAGNRIRFVEADACALPFEAETFDRVLAVECIFHFPSRLGFLEEAVRVLKPGGRLALSDFVPIYRGNSGPAGKLGAKLSEVYGPLNGWPDGSYRAMAKKAGLRLVLDRNITSQTLPTYPVIIRESPEMAAATRILEWLSRLRLLRYRVLAFEKPSILKPSNSSAGVTTPR